MEAGTTTMIIEKAGEIHTTKGRDNDCATTTQLTDEGRVMTDNLLKFKYHFLPTREKRKFKKSQNGGNSGRWESPNGAVALIMLYSGHLGLYSLKPGTKNTDELLWSNGLEFPTAIDRYDMMRGDNQDVGKITVSGGKQDNVQHFGKEKERKDYFGCTSKSPTNLKLELTDGNLLSLTVSTEVSLPW